LYYIAFFPISQAPKWKIFCFGGIFLKTVGIICEYNPLHRGHAKQIRRIREEFGPDTAIVCAMSGNFVQRGYPAIADKSLRARAAILCGADLVLELPVTAALSSAEGFAVGGVSVLSKVCDTLCFGAETADKTALLHIARMLLSEAFPPLLRAELDKGLSFPAARQAALTAMGADAQLLSQPNNILAVEYCKAILQQNAALDSFPILREGDYHAEEADYENPSATAIRALMYREEAFLSYIPEDAQAVFADATLHSIAAGERAILSKLRTMTEAEFEALPYGSEGLWRKLMHACRQAATLEEILAAVKSKRYTRTRLDRMVMCAFLGITQTDLESDVPYTRVLAFNDTGRRILKQAKKEHCFLNAGEAADHPYWELEKRCSDLYGLFAVNSVEAPGLEENRRVYYHRET
jgi:predicted nucleotidyltransferase